MSATTSFKLPEGTVLKGGKYRYKIIKHLGQGAFGITYQAEVMLEAALGVLKSDAKVAVKEFFLKDINERKGTELSIGNSSAMFVDYRNKFRKEAINLSKMEFQASSRYLNPLMPTIPPTLSWSIWTEVH